MQRNGQQRTVCYKAAGSTVRNLCAAVQMTSMSLLLATSGGVGNRALEVMALMGAPMLCFATFLTLWSLADYMRGVWPYM